MRLLLTSLAILAVLPLSPAMAQSTGPRNDLIGAARDMLGGHGKHRVVGNPDPIYRTIPEYDPKTGAYGGRPTTTRTTTEYYYYRYRY